MHDGRLKTLEDVVEHDSRGVHSHENLGLAFEDQEPDQLLGFKFTDKQKGALVAFLRTLTDERFVADPKFVDPFVRLTEQQSD